MCPVKTIYANASAPLIINVVIGLSRVVPVGAGASRPRKRSGVMLRLPNDPERPRQALHRAAREAGDIQKDVIKAAGVTSNKYSGMDTTLGEIATDANALVNFFEHPTETSRPAFQKVQQSLNSLTAAVEKAQEIYTANGGPGIPTPEIKEGSTSIAAAVS